jgi:NTP pyrophosphatase (non-canonical NTP hydrolase)
MTLDEYQTLARQTAIYPRTEFGTINSYPALGLAGETGEVCENIKKTIRDDNSIVTKERKEALAKELGDVLWYLANLATELGLSLNDVAQKNIIKLAERQKNNTIHGSGDNR